MKRRLPPRMNTTARLDLSTRTVLSNATDDQVGRLFTEWEAVLYVTLIAIMAIFGFAANAITILVIRADASLRESAFNILLVSLAISDIVSAMNSMSVIYVRTFGFVKFALPSLICKVASSLLWIESILSTFIIYMITSGVYANDPGAPNCSIGAGKWRSLIRTYRKYTAPILQHIPSACIVACSIVIGYKLLRMSRVQGLTRTSASDKKERSALKQVAVIVLSYLAGNCLHIVFRYLDALHLARDLFTWRSKWLYWTTSYTLTRASECLNPFCYNYGSSQLWKATKCYFRKEMKTNHKRSSTYIKNTTTSQGSTNMDVKRNECVTVSI